MVSINLDDYNYNLPKELIAQEAFHPRDKCKLMLVREDKIEHKIFSDIIDELNPGDVLVLNETKVERCKLIGNKDTGARVEITLVRILADGVYGSNAYETRIKGSNLKVGVKLMFKNNSAVIQDKQDDKFFIRFDKPLKREDLEILTPPYIKKKVIEKDYQTVFANKEGSLAAPTAGLHFTPELLSKIESKGVKIAKVQLDISFETFLPVRDVEHHKTGQEHFIVDDSAAQIINSALSNGGKLVAVGTTVVKTLESCEWKDGRLIPSKGISEIFIKPGFKFRAPIAIMVTNFHLPKSSLLLLTAAYGGKERILTAYNEAVKQKYRFFSLGDAMMIFRK